MMLLTWLLGCGPSLDEPATIAYDHVACDHCGMVVSDPRFAVQIATDAERLVFDDPICAFRTIAERGPHLRHVWFRDSSTSGEEWLDWQEVAFVPASGAPMDGGLAAVPVYTDNAISFSEASSRALAARR
jgi:hypothetical protein